MHATRFKNAMTAGIFAVLSLALGGASCDKKSVANPAEPGPSVPFEAPPKPGASTTTPPAKPSAAPAAPAAAPKPADPASQVGDLLGKLPSPCGKAMSLQKTLDSDPSCKQAPFAKKFVERLVNEGVPEDALTQLYDHRYADKDTYTFTTRETPFIGTASAPVVLVEFFDYACPHCRLAEPLLEDTVAKHGKDVVLYFKNFPLHKESMDTAKAAIAAARQGKFKPMHQALFAHQGSQSREEIFGYAKELGLDMAKFEKDFNDPATEARVKADKAEGEKTKLQGTPTVFVNGRMMEGTLVPGLLDDWIDEEVAVNR
jgi:protein-disulfide isomerase